MRKKLELRSEGPVFFSLLEDGKKIGFCITNKKYCPTLYAIFLNTPHKEGVKIGDAEKNEYGWESIPYINEMEGSGHQTALHAIELVVNRHRESIAYMKRNVFATVKRLKNYGESCE